MAHDDPFAQRPRYFSQVTQQLTAVAEQMRRTAKINGAEIGTDGAALLAAAAGILTELRVIEDLLIRLVGEREKSMITLARPS